MTYKYKTISTWWMPGLLVTWVLSKLESQGWRVYETVGSKIIFRR
jgi:hypothetical protein